MRGGCLYESFDEKIERRLQFPAGPAFFFRLVARSTFSTTRRIPRRCRPWLCFTRAENNTRSFFPRWIHLAALTYIGNQDGGRSHAQPQQQLREAHKFGYRRGFRRFLPHRSFALNHNVERQTEWNQQAEFGQEGGIGEIGFGRYREQQKS